MFLSLASRLHIWPEEGEPLRRLAQPRPQGAGYAIGQKRVSGKVPGLPHYKSLSVVRSPCLSGGRRDGCACGLLLPGSPRQSQDADRKLTKTNDRNTRVRNLPLTFLLWLMYYSVTDSLLALPANCLLTVTICEIWWLFLYLSHLIKMKIGRQ